MSKYSSLLISVLFVSTTSLYAAEKHEWAYDGNLGPANWGELTNEFDTCRRGQNQSPIDLVADHNADLVELRFEYTKGSLLKEVNTGHAIQENIKPGNYLLAGDSRFELKQFHFHAPSEHLVNGNAYPMEVHLVHQNKQGAYAVIGLLFEQGAHNEIMDRLPSFKEKRGEDPYADPIDYNELIPSRQDYYRYNGSLTTPPCTEGVTWIVMKEPIIASKKQIDHYHDLLGFDNNRPVQPKNSRLLLE